MQASRRAGRWRLDFIPRRRYALGMTRKIAISLPDSTLEKAKAAIRAGKAPNVSSYIARLIEGASATETFDEMIAAWVRESGASQEEINAAREESRRAFERAGLLAEVQRPEKATRKAS
jgi:Arc/MetJ-type ribon-helix-helix transcriptional regulator